MGVHAFECFISLYHRYGTVPFYVCRTQVIDRRFLRSLLKKFCSIHCAEYGCITCDDIAWRYIGGYLEKV